MRNRGKTKRSFSEALYAKLKTSVFAAVLTSYRAGEKTLFSTSRAISPALRSASEKIASSGTVSLLSRIASFLLSLRLKVYGALVMSFGIYTAIFYFANNFILSNDRRAENILIGVIAAASAIPLTLSDETLSSALVSSRFGRTLSRISGIRPEEMQTDEVRGKSNFGFIAGIAAGVVAYFTSPLALIFTAAALVLFWLIFKSPEFGLIFISFAAPFASLKCLAALAALILLSLILKVVRGKRYLTLETLDVAVIGIFFVLIASSVAPFDKSSSEISLTMALCITVYFLAANIARSKRRIDSAAGALVKGAALAAAVIVCTKIAGIFFPGVGATVAGIFGNSLLGERIAGIDPASFNMLVTAAMPMALARFICPPDGERRGGAAAAMILMAFPLAEYRSGFAIFAAAAALMLLLVIYSSKFIYLPIALAALGGVTYFAFPSFAAKVLSVFGAGFDSFAAMRQPAWNGAAGVLSRSFIGGVGFGPGAFRAASDAVSAASARPTHAYNTVLQFWIEGGILAFVLLIAFTWLMITAFFKTADTIDLAKRSPALKGARPAKRSDGSAASFAEEFAVTRRICVAGPFCSVVALIIYGMADHIFEDVRVFLIFWLAAGIAAAGVRTVRHEISDFEASYKEARDVLSAECDLGDE